MNEEQVAEAFKSWLEATLEELEIVYPYVTAGKAALPDAVVDVTEKRITRGDPDLFPFETLEQTWLRVFELEVSFLTAIEPPEVDPNPPNDPLTEEQQSDFAAAAEQAQLRDFGERIEAALFEAHFRLPAAEGPGSIMLSPNLVFDYSAPFVEYDDGTRGRQMVLSAAVGESVAGLN